MSGFKLSTNYTPAGDQPKAIEALVEGVKRGDRHQTLLGATGTGKTYTAANVIAQIQKPTLVIAHNKTLAAQLAQEYADFFPENDVHYFVSYYDYYQPEAYMPTTDTYIEKEAMINEEIERLRHASTQALLSRRDVIIVASVSCIYGLGSPIEYEKVHKHLETGMPMTRHAIVRALISLYFERTNADLTPGLFRAIGNTVEIMPTNERVIYRLSFAGDTIGKIERIDAVTREIIEEVPTFFLFPAKHFITPEDERQRAIADIEEELKSQLAKFERAGKLLEYERLKRRTQYDLALIREIGYCNGIENYSRHFDGRAPGEAPYTLLSYFPHKPDGSPDFLTIIDESHVTIPQLGGMYAGDRSRKETLVEHGFRLPSACDNRPLMFEEFEERVGQTIYTSATPGTYEHEHSTQVVEQIIRPTGLVDPEIIVRPIVSTDEYPGQVRDFIEETGKVVRKVARGSSQKTDEESAGDTGAFLLADETAPPSPISSASRTREQSSQSTFGKPVKGGGRVLVTTLTKKMAEDLSEFLKEQSVKAEYIHSEIKTLERIEILTNFRKGEFDVLVGVNLLREGLDLPEVELVAILDADKEGFLRSETSLIQTIGRAARNVAGRVILYADEMTGSLEKAIGETNRRRELQLAYNKEHGITPATIKKEIKDITEQLRSQHEEAVDTLLSIDRDLYKQNPKKLIKEKTRQMNEAVKILDFETAAILRDEIRALEERKT